MDIEFEPQTLPALVLGWEDAEEMIVLKNQGYDLMEATRSIALSIDSDGYVYGLRENSEGKLVWELVVDVAEDKPKLGVINGKSKDS